MQPCLPIKFKLLREGATLPKRGTPGSGGFDIFAPEGGFINPGEYKLIGLGIAHDIPVSMDVDLIEAGDDPKILKLQFHGLLVSRSGLAVGPKVKLGFDPCLIDNDYRGEIKALMYNDGPHKFSWAQGERLCQIIYVPCYAGDMVVSESLSDTQRGGGGFGSTGA